MTFLRVLVKLLALLLATDQALGLSRVPTMAVGKRYRSVLVTGGNKGQGYALCERILAEHDDTRVFLCSRDKLRGEDAAAKLCRKFDPERLEMVVLDVKDEESVLAARDRVRDCLGGDGRLHGLVSNAGILWGHSMEELVEVCAIGVRRVLDAFLPLVDPDGGRAIVVSSGLGPLMYGFASEARQKIFESDELKWDDIQTMIDECLQVEREGGQPDLYKAIGFPGGPFADAAPDFHKYGLAKLFADVYMRALARTHPNLRINSCDPGLVYTDLILKMPRYEGKAFEETGAKNPAQGVEAAMRLLFGGPEDGVMECETGGRFYAMKGDELLSSDINERPDI